MRSYNNTYHRSIGMAPSEVTSANQETVWQRLYGHESVGTPKFTVGDRVRISKAKRHFEKGYMANWTEELFTIVDAHRSEPPVYRLVDWHGDKLDGTFYEPELQKVIVPKGKTYRVESVLRWRNKRTEVFVKWSGFPTSFNSWIDAKTLVNYQLSRYNGHALIEHVSHARCSIGSGRMSCLVAEQHTDTSTDR